MRDGICLRRQCPIHLGVAGEFGWAPRAGFEPAPSPLTVVTILRRPEHGQRVKDRLFGALPTELPRRVMPAAGIRTRISRSSSDNHQSAAHDRARSDRRKWRAAYYTTVGIGGRSRNRTSLPGFGDQADPRSPPIRRTSCAVGRKRRLYHRRLAPMPGLRMWGNPTTSARRNIDAGKIAELGIHFAGFEPARAFAVYQITQLVRPAGASRRNRTALPVYETGAFPECVERQMPAA